MRKRRIEHIEWMEVAWERPYQVEAVWQTLTHLASLTPRGAVVWEVRGHNGHITHLLGADRSYIGKIKEVFRTYGNVRFREAATDERQPVSIARTLKITHPQLSLNTNITESVIRAGLAALSADKSGKEVVLQIVLGRSFAPTPTPANLDDPTASWLSVIAGCVSKATAEARKSVREKAEQHSFQAVIRIGVSGEGSTSHLRSVISALKVMESAGVRIHDEAANPSHLNTAHVPWHWPLQLSVKELANFLLLPVGEDELPGTPGIYPKLTLPPVWYRQPTNLPHDRSFATSMDMTPKLSISPGDSLEHTLLIGPTGSGKSTAMQHLILADIKAGRSVLVIDPKADLVNDILARIPEERADDVVVIDPSEPNPCGFNPLALKNQHSKALVADVILSVFKELWADSWGVRIQDILSAALLTLVETEGATLLWFPPLLTDENFRRKITSQIKDRVALQPFWSQFEALSESQRHQQIEPVLNKLRQFLLRPGLRNILGQAQPKFNLADLFTQRKIVLVPLNKGIVGGQTAQLLGSLIVGLTWTLALSRANLPPERRHIVSVYIDELQDYISSLSADLSDSLAQARGLGVGMTLAHQYRDQLPLEIRSGIDANCRNKIVFGLNVKDAKDMAAMAPELTAEDFMALPRYQVYTSFQHHGRNTGWILGKTLPPTPTLRDPVELRARSMTTYGTPAEAVEAEYLKILDNHSVSGADPDAPIGRRKR